AWACALIHGVEAGQRSARGSAIALREQGLELGSRRRVEALEGASGSFRRPASNPGLSRESRSGTRACAGADDPAHQGATPPSARPDGVAWRFLGEAEAAVGQRGDDWPRAPASTPESRLLPRLRRVGGMRVWTCGGF